MRRKFSCIVASPGLGAFGLFLLGEALLLPPVPARLGQLLLDNEVAHAKRAHNRQVQRPGQHARTAQHGREYEPRDRRERAGDAADEHLLGRVVVEVDAAPGGGGGEGEADGGDAETLDDSAAAARTVFASRRRRLVAHEEEEGEGDAPEKHKLGVGAGHAVPFAVDLARALLLDEALEDEVEGLAGELAGEEEGDFDFARGEDQGEVDDAEGLGEEGEVCAEEGDVVVGVL